MKHDLQLQDIGEQGLLARVQQFCPPAVIGDDGAVLQPPPGESLVVTTDLLVDGVHFSLGMATPDVQTMAAWDVGWRSVAANLSDLAAMGATPLGITVGLSLLGQTPVQWIEELYQGMSACLAPTTTPIVGGDICRSPVFTVAITAFGTVDPGRVIARSHAQPGDAILVTGIHGASRAGLELLLHPEQGAGLSAGDRTTLIHAHQRPTPRLDVISRLHALMPTDFRVAGMDSSDGLADAVLQICRASGVGARLDRHQIPLPPVTGWLSEEQTLRWALYGGEDFELVLCLPEAIAHNFQANLGSPAAIIGEIVSGSEVVVYDDQTHTEEILSLSQGFQHFAQSG